MKINFLYIFAYLLILGFLTFLIIVYGQPFLLMLLVPFLLVPVLDIFLFMLAYKNSEFLVYTNSESVEAGNNAIFYLDYKSDAKIKYMIADIKFTVNNLYYPTDKIHHMFLLVSPYRKPTEIPVENDRTGLVTFRIVKTVFHDYLSFLSVESYKISEANIPVLPVTTREIDVPLIAASDGLDEFTESDSKGNVSSDVKEIREYRPGDRLQRIHWKLSAKLDDLFVKEMAHTSVLSLIILPELDSNDIEETFKTLLSVTRVLNKREDRFEICLYNNNICNFDFMMVNNEEELLNMFIKLYYLPLYEGKSTALDAYNNSGQKFGTIIHITGKHIKIEENVGVIC